MKIENIVASGALNCEIDLKELSSQCPFVVYGKNRYPGGYVKFDGHSVTIYRTGKYIMPGMTSFEDLDLCFKKFLSILSPYIDVSNAEQPSVKNMVCSSTFGCPLNLAHIYSVLLLQNYDVVYEPESFPGLILKTGDSTFNIFGSGKYLILGCDNLESSIQAENEIKQIMKPVIDW